MHQNPPVFTGRYMGHENLPWRPIGVSLGRRIAWLEGRERTSEKLVRFGRKTPYEEGGRVTLRFRKIVLDMSLCPDEQNEHLLVTYVIDQGQASVSSDLSTA